MDQPTRVLEGYVAAWNAQDGQGLAALYHDAAERISPMGKSQGGTGVREFAERLWRAAPDSRIEIPHSATNGNVVFYEFIDHGTHTGPLATPAGEVSASGRSFQIHGAAVLEIRDGRIAAERLFFDVAQFMAQLGISR